jgi:hypothetical protein
MTGTCVEIYTSTSQERRGKKKQVFENKGDENPQNSAGLGESRDWIAKKVGLGNHAC